ncbi:MAG: serine hydrolase [Mycobacteriales bacterium]
MPGAAQWTLEGVSAFRCASPIEGDLLIGQGAEMLVTPASVVKVQIALTVLEAIDQGRLDGAARVTLQPASRTPGPVGISLMADAVEMSIRDLLIPMITISDNVAADALLNAVGDLPGGRGRHRRVQPGKPCLHRRRFDRAECHRLPGRQDVEPQPQLDLRPARRVEGRRREPRPRVIPEQPPPAGRVEVAAAGQVGGHDRHVTLGVGLAGERLRVPYPSGVRVGREPAPTGPVPGGLHHGPGRARLEPLVAHMRHATGLLDRLLYVC